MHVPQSAADVHLFDIAWLPGPPFLNKSHFDLNMCGSVHNMFGKQSNMKLPIPIAILIWITVLYSH